MHSFTYTNTDTVERAIQEKVSRTQTAFVAGGTNLIDLMKANVAQPQHLVGINRLSLRDIEETADGGLRLGALVTNAETAYHPSVEKRYPLLSKAILSGASAQLRNMATNGGNLMQRTRCPYFYDRIMPCNKREPGSGCSAIEGFNRMHAVLGTQAADGQVYCIATFPSDMCVALAALEARVCLQSPEGERVLPIADFHRLPETTPERDNNLGVDELITGLELPNNDFSQHYSYLKIRDRTSYAFALVSVAVALRLDGPVITDARLALGGVAHKPWRSFAAEESLKRQPATEEAFRQAAELALDGAIGYGQNNFKIKLAKQGIVRALQQAIQSK